MTSTLRADAKGRRKARAHGPRCTGTSGAWRRTGATRRAHAGRAARAPARLVGVRGGAAAAPRTGAGLCAIIAATHETPRPSSAGPGLAGLAGARGAGSQCNRSQRNGWGRNYPGKARDQARRRLRGHGGNAGPMIWNDVSHGFTRPEKRRRSSENVECTLRDAALTGCHSSRVRDGGGGGRAAATAPPAGAASEYLPCITGLFTRALN